jgi:hypothetical protein
MVPFKHYVAAEIERVLRHASAGGKLSQAPSAADERTLRRWWKEFRPKLEEWAGRLKALLFRLTQQIPSLLHNSSPFQSLEESLSRLPPLPLKWTVLVKTLWWMGSQGFP